jgi:photosynthetic reaction center cytochrome c subunit
VARKSVTWTGMGKTRAFCLVAGITVLCSGWFVKGRAQATAGQTASQKYKNVQVLKDIPADQLIPAMQFITGSLGVECDFCHVEKDGKMEFDSDDKKEKKVARKMMQMMFAINQNNFEGEREVTCNTCHRGSPHPQGIPAIPEENSKMAAMPEHQHAVKPAEMPSGIPVLMKYIDALGGPDALGKVTSRVEKGKALVPGGPAMPITIYTQSPDRRVSMVQTPRGDSVTAYNGQGGWLSFPGRPPHEMSAEDQLAAKIDAEAFYPNLLQQQFTELTLRDTSAKVGDQEANLVVGIVKGQPPVKFFFDKTSGLLLRMVHYVNTPLGLNPIQIDFSDYRALEGVKTPYRWTLARPSGAFTIQIDDVRQNVPIEASRFEEPKPAPATAPASGASQSPQRTPSMPSGPKPPQGSVPPGSSAPAPGA